MSVWAVAALAAFLQQSPKASIEGYVVRAGTNDPIAGAQITVRRSSADELSPAPPDDLTEIAQIPVVTTDSQGRFIVKDLEAGSYGIVAARNGFARQQYGERAPGRPGSILRLTTGQVVKYVVFRMISAGAVGGRVSDASGEPIPGIAVQLLKSIYDGSGKRTFQTISTARTDERGEYRMYLVTPGRYFVSASPSQDHSASFLNEVHEPGYVLTYYPGGADPSAASSIEIQPGDELSNVDFRLNKQRLFRIRGRIVDTRTGKPPGMINISILARDPLGASRLETVPERYDPRNGTFELHDVPPGPYWLQAQALPESQSITQFSLADFFTNFAQAPIEVSNSDVENVTLAFTAGFSISGRIAVEGTTASPPANLEKITVFLNPDESSPVPSLPQQVKPDGSFVLEKVQPGNYRLNMQGEPPNSYVKSIVFAGRDVLNGISVSGPVSDPLEVVLSTAAGQIEGTIVDKDGKPMRAVSAVLIPNRQRERRDLYRMATSDEGGRFKIPTVVPGDYKLFAWEDLESFAYHDADFLRKYEEHGVPVSVAENGKITVDAKMIPARQ